MTKWTETYRGTVAPWECDVTEHFTVACYFDRIDQAAASIAETLGAADGLRSGGFARRFDLRFTRELRAGDSFHVESAAIGLDEALRLGHRIVDFGERRPSDMDRGGVGRAARSADGRTARCDQAAAGDLGRAGDGGAPRTAEDGRRRSKRARPGQAGRSRRVRAFLPRRLCSPIYRCGATGGSGDWHDHRVYKNAAPRLLDL